ncbi:MAG: RecX family transcriptional regulator [Clostridia bacterium]|nr:RecX family transcriptional regulator [Clostridia bacterium]
MNISVYRVLAVENGEAAEISMEISNGREVQQIKGAVSAAMFAEIGLPLNLKAPLSIEKSRCEEILRYMKLYSAIKKGIYLLGYARNTARALTSKLKMKGYPEDIAEEAVEYLKQRGYIRESEEAVLFAERLAKHKLYGQNRIRKEMFAKGFPEDVIREALEAAETDFSEICARRIRSMGGPGIFANAEDRNKAISALLRYGFSSREIREATALLQNEDE